MQATGHAAELFGADRSQMIQNVPDDSVALRGCVTLRCCFWDTGVWSAGGGLCLRTVSIMLRSAAAAAAAALAGAIIYGGRFDFGMACSAEAFGFAKTER